MRWACHTSGSAFQLLGSGAVTQHNTHRRAGAGPWPERVYSARGHMETGRSCLAASQQHLQQGGVQAAAALAG